MSNLYEDKISKLEIELNKKEKDIKVHKSNLNSLKHELETLGKKMEILLE